MTTRTLSASVSRSADLPTEIARALDELRTSVERSNEQIARLTSALERALRLLERSEPAGASSAAPAEAAPTAADRKPAVVWVIGPEENAGWAYGNNARRLAEKLPGFQHIIGGSGPADVAVYFDAIIAERYPVEAARAVLRIGGPRPLDRLYGDDEKAMARAFERFDAIIALNAELFLRASRVHRNVHLVPNALDLKAWSPASRKPEDRPFTVGFAASLKSSAEAEVKGFEIAKAAAARAGVRLLLVSKGSGQIPHDRMIPDFYSRIDALVAPYGPGREGTSNVIMEALALGIPVVTTVHAGYHGEALVDRKNALICERDEIAFAEALSFLQRDERLRRRISAEARAFAERHHDLAVVAREYARILSAVLAPPRKTKARKKKVAFVPFWEPAENFGSSRLRAKYPSEYLRQAGTFDVVLGYQDDADIVVIVQMCHDGIMEKIKSNRDQFVIYDVCDKYYENERVFRHVDPPISSLKRYGELMERADLIIVPSRELKAEVASRAPHKPVKFVPEPIDYDATGRPARPADSKTVLWFGNPDRGNFESARWMIERLVDVHGYQPLIVSRRSFFKAHPALLPHCQDWSLQAMEAAFAKASLCVVAYDPAEQAKSPNRFIAAMMQGVPTLSCNSPAVSELLEQTGHQFADIRSAKDLDRAVAKLAQPGFRELFVKRVQRHLNAAFGRAATTETYTRLLQDNCFAPAVFSGGPRRVAFVTHNLSLGEGAPWSLFELVSGLAAQGISPFVVAPGGGPLAQQYASAGINLEIFDPHARHMVKTLNSRFPAVRERMAEFLKRHGIEAVVCNTVKSAPLADVATSLGIPSLVIVRESYQKNERFEHFSGEAKLAAIRGLTMASDVVFVAETSRAIWADHPLRGRVHVIPNGISGERFASVAAMSQAEARAAVGLPADGLIALCVGTINARKGQKELMQAFCELPAEIRERLRIVFLGAVEGSGLAEFLREHERLAPEFKERLVVVPATEEVAAWYRAADMFLMNSSSEAYPRSVVEALLSSLPVVSTKVFGVTEQVRDGQSGFLYDFNDMEAWKRHVSALVGDDALRARMSREARRAFWKLTGYQEMLLAYKTILSRIVEGKR
jgi:glycosyltransferase involved in cell wall biosynthesis